MAKITYTADDGSTQDFNDQAYTDAAVAAAVAALGSANTTAEVADVRIENTDGSSETFVPAAE